MTLRLALSALALALAACGTTAPVQPDSGTTVDAGCATTVGLAEGDVVLPEGAVRGAVDDGGVRVFRGIPYASPPVGERRWKLPEPQTCFPGGFVDATAFASVCPQYAGDGGLTGSEDCLALNVWTPARATAGSLPVLVFVHGGAHEQGAGSLSTYDGSTLAQDQGVVVVTFNYRLGPFGFLSHPALSSGDGGVVKSGNLGMHDQLAALAWVKAHIAAFGGDPARVLLFGQSAGAVSVCRLLVSPLAAGLFSSAAMHSGACVASTLATAETKGQALATAVGCGDPATAAACLGALDTAHVMAGFTPATNGTGSVGRLTFDGVVDGYAVPDAPRALLDAGTFQPVPVVVMSNTSESGRDAPPLTTQQQFRGAMNGFLGPLGSPTLVDAIVAQYPDTAYGNSWRQAFIAATTDAKFTCGARRDARLLARRNSKPTWRAYFADSPDNAGAVVKSWGAFHSLDLLYVFGTLPAEFPALAGPGDLSTISAMQAYWTGLAAHGVPSSAGAPAWPAYTEAQESLQVFRDGASTLQADPRGAHCDFWDALSP